MRCGAFGGGRKSDCGTLSAAAEADLVARIYRLMALIYYLMAHANGSKGVYTRIVPVCAHPFYIVMAPRHPCTWPTNACALEFNSLVLSRFPYNSNSVFCQIQARECCTPDRLGYELKRVS